MPLTQGRTFTEDELLHANSTRVIVTHEFWQTHFAGVPDVLGRTLIVDGISHEVIGVLPPRFQFLDSSAKFYIPNASNLEDRAITQRHSNNHQMIARLAPGATLASGQAQMDAFNEIQLQDDPFAELIKGAQFHTRVFSLHADTVRNIKPTLVLL